MFNKIMKLGAIGVGLFFIVAHTIYTFHLLPTEQILKLYVTGWRLYLSFFILSIIYPVFSLFISIFKKDKSVAATFVPVSINVVVFILTCLISLCQT